VSAAPTPPGADRSVADRDNTRRPPEPPPAAGPSTTSLELAPQQLRRSSIASPAFVPRRTTPGALTALTPRTPTVLLNRLQSGVGSIRFHAVWAAPHDARLGCVYRLRSGYSTVAWPGGVPGQDDPLVVSMEGEIQSITLDMLRCKDLDRMLVFALTGPQLPAQWTGMLLITTYGGARIEVPVEPMPGPGVLVLLSAYNVLGELVLRAERERVAGTARDAAIAYGFDGVTWFDGFTVVP
jgi:hypothetical protein